MDDQRITLGLRERIARKLTQHGVHPTPQRLEIGQVLFDRARHVTAEQVIEALKTPGEKSPSKATVYNTLKLFVERRLLRAVHIDPTRTVYDTTVTPHHHFLNVDTGELTDIPFDDLVVDPLPELPTGMALEGVEVIVRMRGDGSGDAGEDASDG